MTNTNILKQLDKILIEALQSKEAYKSKYQEFLTTFIKNYDVALNKNSEPLYKFFKKLDNIEKVKVNLWLIKNTSLDGATVHKEGLKLRFKEGYDSFTIFNEALNWYEMKVDVKPYEPSDDKLKKSLVNLLKHYDKESIKSILATL